VAEALFAVGNVFSFARIIYLFQTNPYLGPLQVKWHTVDGLPLRIQISLGCMLVDVARFCFIFGLSLSLQLLRFNSYNTGLIISSFSIGLAQLYWYYDSHTR